MSRILTYDRASPASIHIVQEPVPSLPPGSSEQVLVQFLASPINRVDQMLLAGQYPLKPRYHGPGSHPIPGFDGCAVVLASNSPDLSPGDKVLPLELGLGTWRTHAILPRASLLRLPPATPPAAAALLRSGAVIAALLLDEAVVRCNDSPVVIVSAGTSIVARFLVQLARLRGFDVVLVIRDRPEDQLQRVEAELVGLGARAVVSETQLAQGLAGERSDFLLGLKPTVALDCVFGSIGQLLVEALAPGGTFVLVGMLSGPGTSIQVETKHLFNKQLSFVPFRGSDVLKKMGDAKVEQLFTDLANHFIQGRLELPDIRLIAWNEHPDDAELEIAIRDALQDLKDNEVGYRKTIFLLS